MTDHTELLDTYLRSNFGKPYVPGQHDCVLFIAAWADLVSGSNHADLLRNSYQTHFAGLRKHVAKHGSISLAVQARLLAAGWQLIQPPLGARAAGPLGQTGPADSVPLAVHRSPITDHPAHCLFLTGDIILTDGDHPGIWRGKSIVASAFGFAGHAYLHRRHATAALRWVRSSDIPVAGHSPSSNTDH